MNDHITKTERGNGASVGDAAQKGGETATRDDRVQEGHPESKQNDSAPSSKLDLLRIWLRGRGPKHLWRRIRLGSKAFSSFVVGTAGVAGALYIGFLLFARFTGYAIEISPISVTKSLNDQGYTPSVVAERLRDAVNKLIVKAKSTKRADKIALRDDEQDITVPTVGLSIDSIVAAVSSHFSVGNLRGVSGEIIQKDGQLWLTIRITGAGVIGVYSTNRKDPDTLFIPAGQSILESFDPYFIGAIFWKEKKFAKAEAEDREAIRLDPHSPYGYFGLGVDLRDEGKLDEAATQFHEAVRVDPHSANAHVGLGDVLQRERRFDEAEAEFREAMQIDPVWPDPHIRLGNVLETSAEFDEAVAEYDIAIRLDPRSQYAYYNLGNALQDEHKFDEAAAAFREAIRLDPRFGEPHNNLGIILDEERKFDDASAELHEAIRLAPREAGPHVNLGIMLAEERKFNEAAAEFYQAMRLDPQSSYPHQDLGNLLERRHELARAVAEFREAIRLDPRYAGSHLGLGIALQKEGKRGEAAAEFRKAKILEPAHYLDRNSWNGSGVRVPDPLPGPDPTAGAVGP